MSRITASQIAEMAMETEDCGVKFYRRAASMTTNTAVKQLFAVFADFELAHLAFFKTMAEDEELKNIVFEHFVDLGQQFNYMSSRARENLFWINSEDSLDLNSCFDRAITVEQTSIKLYTEMRGWSPASFRQTLTAIIDEEKEHYAKLMKMKEEYQKD